MTGSSGSRSSIVDLDADVVALQEVALLTPHGELLDEPLELARLTDRQVRYAAVHAFALIEPEDGGAIGAATWGNALLTRVPVARRLCRRAAAGRGRRGGRTRGQRWCRWPA